MDMDMDVNWCLTCAKRTLDARNPYCSEACRRADTHIATTTEKMTATTSAPLPHPVFSNTYSPSPKNAKLAPSARPPLAPVLPPLIVAPISEPAPRDRRAFSFPAEQMFDTPTKRRDSMILPAFARKPQITHHASTTNASPILSAARKSSLQVPSSEKLSKSSGAITPLAMESVFCSTSESSDNEGTGKSNKLRLSATTSTARPTPVTRTSRSARPSLPVESSKSAGASLRAPSYLNSKEYALRKKSQSPVSPIAGVVASSSSSRSREDIISWAKAVKSRPGDTDTSEDESRAERGRGRSRTRKDAMPARETAEEENLATTPKGRMESVFGGLTIGRFGVGPIVKALTSVTGSGAPPPPPPFQRKESSSSALTSAPAPAALSKVAVVSSTASGNSGFAVEDNHIFFGGATPTLSTVSLSEVNDPTSIATDTFDQEHADLMTNDDQSISATSSSQHRRRPAPMMRETQVKAKQPSSTKVQPTQSAEGPMRPVQSTASVIWNLSTYLRSFAPFSLPPSQTKSSRSQDTSPNKATPSTEISETVSSVAITSPVPASRMPSRAPSPDGEIVRSLPMDIIAPMGVTAANEDRARNREAQEYIEAMGRRSRSRRNSPKRPSRSRGRSPPVRPLETASVHARQWSYDADQSGAEDDAVQTTERRGRSPQAKALIGEDQCMVQNDHFNPHPPAERSWSRGRDAVHGPDSRGSRSRGRRESPRGRGRDRTIRAI